MTNEPWEIVERSDTLNIKAGTRCIARLQKKAGAWDEARLIVQAPEMADAIRRVLEDLPALHNEGRDSFDETVGWHIDNLRKVLTKTEAE